MKCVTGCCGNGLQRFRDTRCQRKKCFPSRFAALLRRPVEMGGRVCVCVPSFPWSGKTPCPKYTALQEVNLTLADENGHTESSCPGQKCRGCVLKNPFKSTVPTGGIYFLFITNSKFNIVNLCTDTLFVFIMAPHQLLPRQQLLSWGPAKLRQLYNFKNITIHVCSQVVQRSKTLHHSARGVTTDPGSIPGCITTGCIWESHRVVHNWPNIIQGRPLLGVEQNSMQSWLCSTVYVVLCHSLSWIWGL